MRSYAYSNLSKSWPTKFLTSQNDAQVIVTRPTDSYATKFILGEFSVHNRSGGAAVLGIGGRVPTNLWTFGFWTDANYVAGTVYADDTVDAQSAAAGDVNLDTVAANNDGFLIGCDVPFNIASLQISQASAATTVWAMYYSIATVGTGFSNNFTAITNAYVPPVFSATGEQLLWFEPPTDWVKASAATAIVNRHGLTVPSQYLLLVKSTTAPNATRGQMSLAILGRMVMTVEGVADNSVLTNIGGVELALPPQCDALCGAISVADSQNRCDVKYRYSG
jgi:hypothetical protein